MSSPTENVEEKKEEGFKRSSSQRKRDSAQFSKISEKDEEAEVSRNSFTHSEQSPNFISDIRLSIG